MEQEIQVQASALTEEIFGAPIYFKNAADGANMRIGADAMVSQFLNIKRNYNVDLAGITEGDRHATRYFCEDDCAYIFEYSLIKSLVCTIERYHQENNPPLEDIRGCIVLFQGLKKELLSEDDPTNWAFGRPTIIATAYIEKQENDSSTEGPAAEASVGDLVHVPVRPCLPGNNLTTDDPPDGYQHPGNGNSGGSLITLRTTDDDHPTVVERGTQDHDTDYLILRVIPQIAWKNW